MAAVTDLNDVAASPAYAEEEEDADDADGGESEKTGLLAGRAAAHERVRRRRAAAASDAGAAATAAATTGTAAGTTAAGGADTGDRASSSTHQLQGVINGDKERRIHDLTCDEALEYVGFGRFQFRMLLMCGLCWMADAAEMIVLSFLILEAQEEWGLSGFAASALGSIVFVGMWIGLTCFGVLADKKGRRIVYLLSMLCILVFGLGSAFCGSFEALLVMRLLVGVGVGGAGVAFTMYSEFLPIDKRGVYLIYFEVFWTVGALIGAGIAWATLPTLGWPWMLGFAALPPLIPLACYYWLPESPRHLLLVGRTEDARNLNGAPEHQFAMAARENRHEFPAELTLAKLEVEPPRGRMRDMFAPEYRTMTLALFVLSFVNCFAYYGLLVVTPGYFTTGTGSGESETNYLEVFIISNAFSSAAELPGIFIAAALINRIGRKKTQAVLLTSTAIFALLLIWDTLPGELLFFFAMVLRMSILGAYAALLVVTAEVFPTKIRATGVGLCGSVARVAGIITPFVAEISVNDSYLVPLAVYSATALLAAVVAMLLPLETAGIAMEEDKPMQAPVGKAGAANVTKI